ncbi:MAG: YtxH domain-containing protein [Rubrobacteridae bacterium]|nr:YtxH domain-containing protein [Rubrobacteridae bacterium]
MGSRLDALRQSAMEAGEQLSQRGSQIAQETPSGNMNILLYALVGVSGFAVGMLMGLLVAPTSGYETRARLGDRASDMLENVKEMARKGEEQISEEAENVA